MTLAVESDVTIGMFQAANGERIKSFSFVKLQPGAHELEMDGSDLSPGLYIYRTIVNGELIQGKLIKTN
ncbi:hypothetical protein [Pseudochryseolinea flava]|uniref:Secretion system C-terminal sorting domain-containing protein n=1 Tax=Pseudochryseolinea flava TaxID=2059302 RepID=A0A364XWA8_9BACT|nr:hypothetical protein [Pseudochryseolinea flava]RAV98241.1 hypothetical protein DQQ10_24885 [Pseudochryseolinea flava]